MMYPDIDKDIVNHSEKLNMIFWSILNDFPSMTKSQKGKVMNAFEEIDLDDKMSVLDELYYLDDNFKRAKFVNNYFFGEAAEEYYDFDYDNNNLRKAQTPRTPRKIIFDTEATTQAQAQSKPQPQSRRVESKPIKREYESMKDLDKLIGLDKVKKQVKELIALTEISRMRQQHNLKSQPQTLHMMFKGNPGTGKTTVARLLGKIFKEIGVLSKGHVIELDRANLISQYQGIIEQKITEYVKQAEGGILFIDEIYSLYKKGDNNDQGKQGIEVLLKAIEDNRGKFICIGAGYTEEVDEFLASNPGLVSRFPIHIDFEDYTQEQLLEIAMSMFKDQDYKTDDSFKEAFNDCMKEEKESENFGNGRVVRNIVESSIREQSLRLFNSDQVIGKDDLMTISKADFKYKPVKLKKKDDEEDPRLELLNKILKKDKETA